VAIWQRDAYWVGAVSRDIDVYDPTTWDTQRPFYGIPPKLKNAFDPPIGALSAQFNDYLAGTIKNRRIQRYSSD
jgi:hypothetical protein